MPNTGCGHQGRKKCEVLHLSAQDTRSKQTIFISWQNTSPENQMGLKPGQSKTVLTGQIMVTGEINIFVLAFKVMTI